MTWPTHRVVDLCYQWLCLLVQAVDEMNGKLVNGRSVYVNRAQKKKERQMELHRRYEAEKMERYNRYVKFVVMCM